MIYVPNMLFILKKKSNDKRKINETNYINNILYMLKYIICFLYLNLSFIFKEIYSFLFYNTWYLLLYTVQYKLSLHNVIFILYTRLIYNLLFTFLYYNKYQNISQLKINFNNLINILGPENRHKKTS